MKPIGYWLNRTDKAFTNHMNDMLAEFNLTRTAWQVLNVVDDSATVIDADIHAALAVNADRATLDAAIATTLADGWTTRTDADRSLALTAEGRRRLAQVGERVGVFRNVSMHGITEDQYCTAVFVLERMALNVETATV